MACHSSAVNTPSKTAATSEGCAGFPPATLERVVRNRVFLLRLMRAVIAEYGLVGVPCPFCADMVGASCSIHPHRWQNLLPGRTSLWRQPVDADMNWPDAPRAWPPACMVQCSNASSHCSSGDKRLYFLRAIFHTLSFASLPVTRGSTDLASDRSFCR